MSNTCMYQCSYTECCTDVAVLTQDNNIFLMYSFVLLCSYVLTDQLSFFVFDLQTDQLQHKLANFKDPLLDLMGASPLPEEVRHVAVIQ